MMIRDNNLSVQDRTGQLLHKMIIGTAQFGLDYGVNTLSAKKINQDECIKILNIAKHNNINMLDTAEAYGDAIQKISDYHTEHQANFEIISKFLHHENIIEPLKASQKKMSIPSYHTILAHKSQDLLFNIDVQRDLLSLKSEGLTKYIGVSIYTNDEFKQSIDSKFVDVIQFPFNLLDNDNQRGELMREAKKAGKILHARSVYLQGMFLKPFPLPDRLRSLEPYLFTLHQLCQNNNTSIASLCLEYVFRHDLIDNVIIGHHTASQLMNNIELISNFQEGEYLNQIESIKVDDAQLLNPRNW